jgi:hypothetical protein
MLLANIPMYSDLKFFYKFACADCHSLLKG